jgi:carbon storage regulator
VLRRRLAASREVRSSGNVILDGERSFFVQARRSRPAHPATKQQGGSAMLVLTRKSNQSIMIGDDIEVSVLSIMGEKVRIGIQAPREVPVFRTEVYLEIQQENVAASEDARDEVDAALRKLGRDE